MNNEWVTVADAARILGVSKQAIRQRIFRDTIPHRKSPGGTVFVRITKHNDKANGENYGENYGEKYGRTEDVSRELIDELRNRVGFLERQLETEQAASAELRRIVAGLVQRVPELEAPEQPSESPESVGEGPGSTQGREESQEAISRPWWRRWFGA